MDAPTDSYWSIEACGWVRSPVREVELPAPRAAEEAEDLIELEAGDDLPAGVPI